jgi:hypothetical protein
MERAASPSVIAWILPQGKGISALRHHSRLRASRRKPDVFGGDHVRSRAITGVCGRSRAFAGGHGHSRAIADVRGRSRAFAGDQGRSRAIRGVRGRSGAFAGVHVRSRAFAGVRGRSRAFAGVHGRSRAVTGVRGRSGAFAGDQGRSRAIRGVRGRSRRAYASTLALRVALPEFGKEAWTVETPAPGRRRRMPANKDWPAHRHAFAVMCASFLHAEIGLIISR